MQRDSKSARELLDMVGEELERIGA
jgi:hypothetical protein